MNSPLNSEDKSPLDLEALQARCLGKLDLVEKVLNTFTRQLDTDLEQLEQALVSEDLTTFALVAHRIKGMSANTEALALAEEAAVAEQAAREGCVEQLPLQVERLRSNRAQFAQAFAARKLANR